MCKRRHFTVYKSLNRDLLLFVKMPKKCSVGYCRSNYKSISSDPKVKVYRFPTDDNELRNWLAVLPNEICIESVTRHMVCSKHLPNIAEMKKIYGYDRPCSPVI